MPGNSIKLNTDKIELIWTDSRLHLSLLGGCGPAVRAVSSVVTEEQSDDV